MFIYIHSLSYYKLFLYLEQLVVRKAMDVNEHERLSIVTLRTQNQAKEHERLSNLNTHKLR
jgi:uncharacterized membrane protein